MCAAAHHPLDSWKAFEDLLGPTPRALSESPCTILNKGTVNSKQPYLFIACILSMHLQDMQVEEALKMLW